MGDEVSGASTSVYVVFELNDEAPCGDTPYDVASVVWTPYDEVPDAGYSLVFEICRG